MRIENGSLCLPGLHVEPSDSCSHVWSGWAGIDLHLFLLHKAHLSLLQSSVSYPSQFILPRQRQNLHFTCSVIMLLTDRGDKCGNTAFLNQGLCCKIQSASHLIVEDISPFCVSKEKSSTWVKWDFMSLRSSSNLIMIHIITKSNLLCGRNNHFREMLAPAGVRRNLATV